MKRSTELQNEMSKLRQMTESDIDYSDISETNENWLAAAALVLELTSDSPKSKISMPPGVLKGYVHHHSKQLSA